MAKARKCDRCGDYFDYEMGGSAFFDGYFYNNIGRPELKLLDLCPECCSGFKRFMAEHIDRLKIGEKLINANSGGPSDGLGR